MWGIIEKIKVFSCLEEGWLGEALGSGAPPLMQPWLLCGRDAKNVRV
jgi:hypothetical protein